LVNYRHEPLFFFPSCNCVFITCLISPGNGTEKVLYGRTVDEIVPAVRPRLQRQRSLRMFHGGSSIGSSTGSGSGRRLSWSEYRSGGGSLKLSQAKAKKLMDECSTHFTDWEDAYDETELPIKAHKGLSYSNRTLLFVGEKINLSQFLNSPFDTQRKVRS